MPRPPRYPLIGVPQHVIQRGNNRQPTFFAEDDFRFYLGCRNAAATTHACEAHAYVLMTNHVHLLLNQCRVLGSERFTDEIEALLSRRVRAAKAGRPKQRRNRKQKFQSGPIFAAGGRDSAVATVPFTATRPPLQALRRLSENRATASSAAGRRPDHQR